MSKCLKCREAIENKKETIYGLHKRCFYEWFQLDEVCEFSQLDRKHPDASLHSSQMQETKDSFYHGQYKKYSARLGFKSYILKVQEERFPELPEVEYICNSIADILGLNVPKYCLIRYPNEHNITFAAMNFMENHKGGTLHHIYKFLPKGLKSYNCKNLINFLQKNTSSKDVLKFIEIVLFDSLIGNGDRHGRNLGIIETARGKQLAPMYDNPSHFGAEDINMMGAEFNISGAIQTSFTKEPKLVDYAKEFQSLGFEKSCFKFFNKAIKNSQKIIDAVESSEISEDRKKAFISFLKKQLKIMEEL